MQYPELIFRPHYGDKDLQIKTTRLAHDYNVVWMSRRSFRRYCSRLRLCDGDYMDITCSLPDGEHYRLYVRLSDRPQ